MNIQEINNDIIHRFNKGDIKAFEMIYNAYYVYICTLATSFVYDTQIAGEIANDVFLNLWNQHEKIHPPLTPYLKKAVQNRSLNYIRSIRSQERIISEAQEYLFEKQEEMITDSVSPQHLLESKELNILVERAIEHLPNKCKSIMKENLHNNLSYQEIAKNLNITESTVRVQIKIALTKIKDELRPLLNLFI